MALLSRAGVYDIVIYRREELKQLNSTIKLVLGSTPLNLSTASLEFDIFESEGHQSGAPTASWTSGGGEVVGQNGGVYFVVSSVNTDFAPGNYYYSLKADGEMVLTGKFVVEEYPDQT